jgi:cyanate permease
MCLGLGTQAMCFYAQQAWLPTLLMRVHKWSPGRTGLVLGLLKLLTGCLGVFIGGRLCEHWLQQGTREAPLKRGFVGTIVAAVFFCAAVL